jgi:hypothetical protein
MQMLARHRVLSIQVLGKHYICFQLGALRRVFSPQTAAAKLWRSPG